MFVGFAAGNFGSGFIGDVHGRRPAILIGYLLIAVFGFATAMSTNPVVMLILRFLVGLGCGIGFPAVYSLIPEVCPVKYRTPYCVCLVAFMPLGEVYAALGVLMIDPHLTEVTDHCDDGYSPSAIHVADQMLDGRRLRCFTLDCFVFFVLGKRFFFLLLTFDRGEMGSQMDESVSVVLVVRIQINDFTVLRRRASRVVASSSFVFCVRRGARFG